MFQYDFITTQDTDSGISYVSADFKVGDVTYIAIFSDDKDTLDFLTENQEIAPIIQNKKIYSFKFAVKSYIELGHDDLYAPPIDHDFGKNEIKELKEHLERLMLEHYLLFKPNGYVFIADRPSLARMYRKMCCKPSVLMADFVPIMGLGDEQDCFIVKTPNY